MPGNVSDEFVRPAQTGCRSTSWGRGVQESMDELGGASRCAQLATSVCTESESEHKKTARANGAGGFLQARDYE
jgi:hypothetical protein